jgi:predicted SAM-dependent methyltransferase
MRILVPDLDIVVQQYQENSNRFEKVEKINNHFWGFKKEAEPPTLHQKILSFFVRGHQWLYNYEYLKEVLVTAGFDPAKIVRCRYQQGVVPNIDFLDNHPDHSLIVEATK